MWKKHGTAGQAADENIIRGKKNERIQTHSEYVILIALPLQEWLRERVSMLRCTCITRLAV